MSSTSKLPRKLAHPAPSTVLKPVLQAYILGLLSVCSPQILQLILGFLRRKQNLTGAFQKSINIVKKQLSPDRFPTACAILILGATTLPKLILAYCVKTRSFPPRSENVELTIRLVSSFVAAVLSFSLLNYRDSETQKFQELRREEHRHQRTASTDATGHEQARALHHQLQDEAYGLAGRTLGLTFFGVVRAADVVVELSWQKYRSRRPSRQSQPLFEQFVETFAAPSVFATSSFIIMWAWFHSPDRLPKAYNKWISTAAQIDPRLIEALRQCRRGNFIYGKDTGLGELCSTMARDLGYPEEWGDPAKTIPIPCELYHSGTGPSCEWHAIVRFARAWRFAFQMYLPLNLLMLVRRKPSAAAVSRAALEASRSAAFLGGFIALFYYGVCSARTRYGPRLFSRDVVTPTMWDGGLCVGLGCVFCGWSIMIEKASRRPEITFFVAPRALATLSKRRYNRRHIWIERYVFAVSAAIVLTTAQVKPEKIRGVFGSLLRQILH